MNYIRKTKFEDIDKVMELFDAARETMKTFGIDQWQDGYPFKENILEDIQNGESYVVVNSFNEIIATFMLMERPEETYFKVYNGAWLNDKKYATIHRITVSPKYRQKAIRGFENEDKEPVTSLIIRYASGYARWKCLTGGIKIDTHEGNIAMRKMLEKNGFVHCGEIKLKNGHMRVCYQKCCLF